MIFPITERVAKRSDHTPFYLACGAADAPLIIFVHGWPDLSIGWRHQLPVFAANLTEVYIKSGHFMAQEQPVAVNRAVARFIAEKLPELL